MAMNFYQAQMAENPNLAAAAQQQGALDQQRRNAQQLRKQQTMTGIGQSVMGANELGLLEPVKGALGIGAAPATGAGTAATAAGAGAGAAGAAGAGAAGAAGAGAAGTMAPVLAAMPGIGWGALAAMGLSKLFG